MTDEDCVLLDELDRLGDTLGPFSSGILTNSLSVTEQLDFSYKFYSRGRANPGRGPDARVIFYVDVHRGKVRITSFDCPFTSEAILEPAQGDSLIDLLARAAKEARDRREDTAT